MLVNKITYGYVTQQYDTEAEKWIAQTFDADGGTVEYEDTAENFVDPIEPSLPFDMVQPQNMGTAGDLEFDPEQSNYAVLEQTLKALQKGADTDELIYALQTFLKPKHKIVSRMDELRNRARGGDDAAASELITELAKMNDGR